MGRFFCVNKHQYYNLREKAQQLLSFLLEMFNHKDQRLRGWYWTWCTLLRSKVNINFKSFRSAEKCLLKPPYFRADIIASIADTFFKYITVTWDSVPIVDTLCCLMSLKASNFIISLTSAGNGDFRNSISLLKRRGSMFLVCNSTFVWKNCANT